MTTKTTKTTTIRVDLKLWIQLKHACVDAGLSVDKWVNQAIEEKLVKGKQYV